MEKICFKCNLQKPLEDFYKHPKMADGHLGKCKECTKLSSAKREKILRADSDWIEKEKARARGKYFRLNYKDKYKPTAESKAKTMNAHRALYPEKYKAKNASQRIVCADGNQRHHWSYGEEHWKDIIELSVLNHNKAHRYMVYDQERFMYRRSTDNVLLDTKEVHQGWINHILENFI